MMEIARTIPGHLRRERPNLGHSPSFMMYLCIALCIPVGMAISGGAGSWGWEKTGKGLVMLWWPLLSTRPPTSAHISLNEVKCRKEGRKEQIWVTDCDAMVTSTWSQPASP